MPAHCRLRGRAGGGRQWFERRHVEAPGRHRRTSDIPFTAVCEPRPGLAAARNAGLRRARGRVLVFIDDDCRSIATISRDLERHYRTGGTMADPRRPRRARRSQGLPFTIKRSRGARAADTGCPSRRFVLGCNMTMHRDVAARIGRFDERSAPAARCGRRRIPITSCGRCCSASRSSMCPT